MEIIYWSFRSFSRFKGDGVKMVEFPLIIYVYYLSIIGNSHRSNGSGKSSGSSDKSSKTNNPPLPSKNIINKTGPSVSQQPSIRAWKNRKEYLN